MTGEAGGLEAKLLAQSRRLQSGCLEWQGGLSGNGYGRIHIEGRKETTHRIAYRLWVGPIADGLQLDHLCRNRRCLEPTHLEPVTHRTNTLRGHTITARSRKPSVSPRQPNAEPPSVPTRSGRG